MPTYSQTTLLTNLPLTCWVVKPKNTYIADDKDKALMVIGEGQKEKLKAISPKIKLKIKLCIRTLAPILSSIAIDHKTCKIKGKLTSSTTAPFKKNAIFKAKIT